MHANEPLPACVRAYGQGKLKRGWRDTSRKARARPPLAAADNETKGGVERAGEGREKNGGRRR